MDIGEKTTIKMYMKELLIDRYLDICMSSYNNLKNI